MPIRPEVRYLIPCWKEPTISGNRPNAHEIFYGLQAKKGYDYPLWQRPFFTLALLSNLHGPCRFCLELRLDQVVREKVIQRTDWLSINPGNDPLRVHPVSIMMKAAELPRRGVYHLCFVWDKEELARATIHAR